MKIANVIGRMHANLPDLNLCWLSVPEFGSCLVEVMRSLATSQGR